MRTDFKNRESASGEESPFVPIVGEKKRAEGVKEETLTTLLACLTGVW
tara:strand:+ start:123 stop:266 length:144 start_codon:yes stop_codon:yes gene_type:complete